MAYPDNLLVQGERVIVNKRPHWKVLILPTILFIVIIAAGVALATWISKSNWDKPAVGVLRHHRGGARCVDHLGAGAVRPVANRTLRHHQPPRVLPHRVAVPPRAPDPARPDREHGNRGHLLGPADGIRIADRRVVGRSAAQVPQRRVVVEGAGAAEPADPRRTGADPPRTRSRAGSWVGQRLRELPATGLSAAAGLPAGIPAAVRGATTGLRATGLPDRGRSRVIPSRATHRRVSPRRGINPPRRISSRPAIRRRAYPSPGYQSPGYPSSGYPAPTPGIRRVSRRSPARLPRRPQCSPRPPDLRRVSGRPSPAVLTAGFEPIDARPRARRPRVIRVERRRAPVRWSA